MLNSKCASSIRKHLVSYYKLSCIAFSIFIFIQWIKLIQGCASSKVYDSYLREQLATVANNSRQFTFKNESFKDANQCVASCLTSYHFKYAAFNGTHCSCFRALKSQFKQYLTDCDDQHQLVQIHQTGYFSKNFFNKFNYIIYFMFLILKFQNPKNRI